MRVIDQEIGFDPAENDISKVSWILGIRMGSLGGMRSKWETEQKRVTRTSMGEPTYMVATVIVLLRDAKPLGGHSCSFDLQAVRYVNHIITPSFSCPSLPKDRSVGN